MLTPVLHPKLDDARVCIGDFRAASDGLDDLVVRIGRMIAHPEYNARSPLNGLAAKWTAEHLNLLQVGSTIVAPPVGVASANEPSPAPALLTPGKDQHSPTVWIEKIQVP